MTETNGPRVLVAAGSKHGSTAEIAARIALSIEAEGCSVVAAPPGEVDDLGGLDAVVVGSAVYAGRWTPDAMNLVRRIGAMEHRPPTWLFSSGPVGDPPKPEEDPIDVAEATSLTNARHHRVFAGRIDRSRLSFGEKAIVRAMRIPDGDFRDWEAIDAWGRALAREIRAQAVSPAN